MRLPRPLLIAGLAALALPAAPAVAQDDPPQKIFNLIVYGDDPCPTGQGEEIVVCARKPESERYRIPKELREESKDAAPAGGGSWAAAVEGYDDIARTTRPDSCSAVGSYGFTGCAALALRQWFEVRRTAGN